MAKPPDAPPTRGVLRVSVSQSGSRAVVGGGDEEEEWEEEEYSPKLEDLERSFFWKTLESVLTESDPLTWAF